MMLKCHHSSEMVVKPASVITRRSSSRFSSSRRVIRAESSNCRSSVMRASSPKKS